MPEGSRRKFLGAAAASMSLSWPSADGASTSEEEDIDVPRMGGPDDGISVGYSAEIYDDGSSIRAAWYHTREDLDGFNYGLKISSPVRAQITFPEKTGREIIERLRTGVRSQEREEWTVDVKVWVEGLSESVNLEHLSDADVVITAYPHDPNASIQLDAGGGMGVITACLEEQAALDLADDLEFRLGGPDA